MGLGVAVAAKGHGIFRVEQGVEGLALADELGDGLVVHELAAFHGVRGDEAVERGDRGQQDAVVLSCADSDKRVVVGFLGVLRKEHQPARVSGEHDIAVVAVDVDGRGDRAVGVCHDDRQAQAGGDRQLLGHIGEALAGRRGEGAGTGSAGADASRHRGMLAFHRHVLRVDAAVGHEFREVLDDSGLRGDGVGKERVRLRLTVSLGDHLVAVGRENFDFSHDYSSPASDSSTILMVPNLHSAAQMPQPLQWS